MPTAPQSRNTTPRTKHECHLQHVYADAEFLADVAAIRDIRDDPEARHASIEQLANEWRIGIDEANFFLLGQIITLEQPLDNRCNLDFDFCEHKFAISFSPDVTEQELLQEWRKFCHIRDALLPQATGRRRRTHNLPDLTFAIFKQQRLGKTFREIFAMYQEGVLPGYSGANSQFSSEDDLERYYRAYQP
ncbi:MAG: hypothetical protein WAW63_00015 [Candidatus Saccharimonadales bacterium]